MRKQTFTMTEFSFWYLCFREALGEILCGDVTHRLGNVTADFLGDAVDHLFEML
jgi:hypothetical protein